MLPSIRVLRSHQPNQASRDSTPAEPQKDNSNGDSAESPISAVESAKKRPESKSKVKRKTVKEEPKISSAKKKAKKNVIYPYCHFLGEPVADLEARNRWPARYEEKKTKEANSISFSSKQNDEDEEEILLARCHYLKAEVDGYIFDLNDAAYIKAGEGGSNYIGKIVELFETLDSKPFFTAQWFYKAEDTVIKEVHASLIDKRRVFFSELKNDNPLDSLVSPLKIVKVSPNMDSVTKETIIRQCDFYYDMSYSLDCSTFANIPEIERVGSDTSTVVSNEGASGETISNSVQLSFVEKSDKPEMSLLDLYSGCGAMSTGLCLGASVSGVNVVTRWAVDINKYACQSLKYNHPETEVRNESADDYLALLKEWLKLCKKYSLLGKNRSQIKSSFTSKKYDEDEEDDSGVPSGEFEVGKLVGICYGDPKEAEKPGVYFQVRWKGYGPGDDTWEPINGLRNCQKKIKEYVTEGYMSNILPLPEDVDVLCGGPPCQGISGFNRYRNTDAPLDDLKNRQLLVFMDIVEFLKPKYVLMENVADILKFAEGFLGRYAFARLVSMNYQARLGMMVAGCYGLPQFRMRVFLWGALPSKKLPQFPLPTHDVVVRGVIPNEFERNVVAYDEEQKCEREEALLLRDAISDLPPLTNRETRDEMPYTKAGRTDFQKYIRSSKQELLGCTTAETNSSKKSMLFDHRPLQLNKDDYQRVCRIPKKKGANFRDLPGVVVRPDNKVEWDDSMERVLLPSGKQLVPDYAMSFCKGTSTKPFGRLWWDEIVPTVVTRAEPHNQVIIHPEQDRVLSIRENARLQGFPDYYKLHGPVKERYKQVGNAVAVPVSRVLGYALGLASQGLCGNEPLLTLPPKFSSFIVCQDEFGCLEGDVVA